MTPEERARFLLEMTPEQRARLLKNIPMEDKLATLRAMNPEDITRVLREMSLEDRAEALASISPEDIGIVSGGNDDDAPPSYEQMTQGAKEDGEGGMEDADVAAQDFSVGQSVECRDEGKEWKPGKVTSVEPLLVQLDEYADLESPHNIGFPWISTLLQRL